MITTIFFKGWIYAFASGLFGATFFMLVEFQSRLATSGTTELRDMWTGWMILLRCAVGIGGATILYFLFQTDLLGEGLWPNIKEMGFGENVQPTLTKFFGTVEFRIPDKNTALLIVWSFLAGYSQSLVPGILTTTSRRGQSDNV